MPTRIPSRFTNNGTRPIRDTQSPSVYKRSIDIGFAALVIILNIAEIIMIARTKKKKKIYELLLLSLSSADMLFGLSNVVVSIIHVTESRKFPNVMEITFTIILFSILTSVLHLLWITLDRLWAVFTPIKHKIYLYPKRVRVVIIATWIFTLIVAGSMFLYEKLALDTQSNSSTSIIAGTGRPENPRKASFQKQFYQKIVKQIISSIIIIADVFFVASYSVLLYLLNRKTEFSDSVSTSRKEKFSLVCVLVAATFIIFTLPYAVNIFINGQVPFWANVMLVMNSGMNSIVYFFSGRLERYNTKKKKKKKKEKMKEEKKNCGINLATSSGTPNTTPLASRSPLVNTGV